MVIEFDAEYSIQKDKNNLNELNINYSGRSFKAKFVDKVLDQTL